MGLLGTGRTTAVVPSGQQLRWRRAGPRDKLAPMVFKNLHRRLTASVEVLGPTSPARSTG
jgi:hypothetical protein